MRLMSKVYEAADVDEFTDMVYELGWTDGLPVFPPTEKRVLAMLDYLGRDPGEVIGVISPGEGIATIEKIAINAVMAGCKPEYLPVVITAVEAMLDERFEHMRVQCSTGGPAPLAIISGPVVRKLGFNYGEGAFTGTGHRANATIGRAIRLILWNIGRGQPGQLSHATYGHPGRYAYLVAERPPDDGNPWEELHVTAGLRSEDSAVSMFPVGSHDQILAWAGAQTLENCLYVIADAFCRLGNFRAATPKLFVINPQAANVFRDAGWSKERFRNALLERCMRPVRDLKRTGENGITSPSYWPKLVKNPEDDDELVPSMIGPDQLQVLVSGGWPPPRSQCIVATSMHGEMLTRKIDWAWD